MNLQPTILTEESVTLPRLRRAPRIGQSALFGILFVAAIILLVLGTLFALSRNPEQTASSYSILLFNLALIVVLGIYLGFRVWTGLFAKKRRQSAPLLHSCLLYTSPSPRDGLLSRMPSSA